ncbi:hypothetical protein Kpho02_67620 [Kitasatospora phosalacinea]|uniref:Uncharacterized protein n=1 Tax=Kitasatospora phosalacinea TaxID=2065 RepID=A0A9W6V3K6_9ACTN|nr:hypothetical protein Kpho02_67620 [Kitasatospora phosalacinea]
MNYSGESRGEILPQMGCVWRGGDPLSALARLSPRPVLPPSIPKALWADLLTEPALAAAGDWYNRTRGVSSPSSDGRTCASSPRAATWQALNLLSVLRRTLRKGGIVAKGLADIQ